MFVEIDAVLRHERDALAAQPFLHDPGRFEVALARVPPIAIHYSTIGRIGACGLVEDIVRGLSSPSAPRVFRR